MSNESDVIVIGLGTCGEDVALRLLAAGLEVTGIEPHLIGGECPYYACLPSKSMIRSGVLVQEARRSDGLVGRVRVDPDWSLVAARVRDEITGGWDDAGAVRRFESRGGRLVRGRGRLTGPTTVAVGESTYTARRGIIIATGSRPLIPPIPGLEDVEYWTTRDAIQAAELPDSLAVLGGGAVGCELSQVFTRFGSRVALVEGASRILPAEEPEASEAVTAALTREGVTVHAGSLVAEVSSGDRGVTVTLADGTPIGAERLLVATGREVDVSGLGGEAAGLYTSSGFVAVDDTLRAAPGIWAIGDVTGKGLLTHVALYQASIAVADLLGAEPRPAEYRAMPRATFTDPEVGSVGLTEQEARESGVDVDVVVKQVPATFRGWLHRAGAEGVIKLVTDRTSDTLMGATVVGPRAGDVLGMLVLAVHARIGLDDLVHMMYPFPTFVGGVGEALGAYGRGLMTVLDPGTRPLFTDPDFADGRS